jgi:hypothetical protein
MAAAADWDWVAPAVPAAALATSAAVWALTASWLALCWLAAWRRRGTRVAGDFPDPPKGGRKQKPNELANPYVKKGGHGGARDEWMGDVGEGRGGGHVLGGGDKRA